MSRKPLPVLPAIFVMAVMLCFTEGAATELDASATPYFDEDPLHLVANAGPNKQLQLPVNSVTIYGNESTASIGEIATYQWTLLPQSQQLRCDMTGSRTSSLHVSNLQAGEYDFILQVADAEGHVATDSVRVSVKAEDKPPVAVAGRDVYLTMPENFVTLYGNRSTDDDGIVSYKWISEPENNQLSWVSNGSSTPVLHLSNLEPGLYMFTLRVEDNNHQHSTDSVAIYVNPEPQPNCPRPHGIANGHWSVQGGYSHSSFHPNTRVLYSCSDTYRLIGSPTIECLSSGKWSGNPPLCRSPEVSCPMPTEITHGRVAIHGETVQSGCRIYTRAEYSCQTRYKLVGAAVVWCRDTGTWSAAFPRCQLEDIHEDVYTHGVCLAPRIAHSRLASKKNNSTFPVGEVVEIVCDSGYRFPHKSAMLQLACKEVEDGLVTWRDTLGIQPPTTCQRIGGCPLPHLSHGHVVDKPGGYMPGDVAPVMCDSGFLLTPSGTASIVCQSDGTWRTRRDYQALPVCQELDCKPPVSIDHGVFQILGLDYVYGPGEPVPAGAVVYYYCKNGYRVTPEDSQLLMCEKGQWSDRFPACVHDRGDPPCPYPSEIPYGTRVVHDHNNAKIESSQVPGGSVVQYTCSFGYRLQGKPQSRCVEGLWSERQPSCMPVLGCGQPPKVAHGDLNYLRQDNNNLLDKLPEGTKVYYFCDDGYYMIGQDIATLVCEDGKWQGKHPVCDKKTHCDPPMDISHGNWYLQSMYGNYGIGTVVSYECDENYKPVGATELVCDWNGHWSEHTPKCLPKEMYCSEPGLVENGFYLCRPHTCDLYSVGTEVHYVCNRNYEPNPDDVMQQTCLAGGVWSAQKPVCLSVAAAPATTNSDGSSTDTSTSILPAVIATSCSVMGLLLFVMVVFAIQRCRKANPRMLGPADFAPPPYSAEPQGTISEEQDRVALIAFADGAEVMLPSYEEAVRGRSSGHRHSRFNSDAAYGSGRSSRSDYRPLPSIPSGWRNGVNHPSQPPLDHHRNSIITTTSTTTRDNLSLAFGSMDTMNVSDGTSTTVTIGTYDSAGSNPSIATSQRAAVGSLGSGESRASLAPDDAPLLVQEGGVGAEHRHNESEPSCRETASPQPHSGQPQADPAVNTDALENNTGSSTA